MASPFIGEIRLFAGNFAPQGWAFCDGRLLAISENDALFNLIGTTYGGDGQSTFGLPDLQGRVPIHQGTGTTGSPYTLGEKAGVEEVTLTQSQMPTHTHSFLASTNPASVSSPNGTVVAEGTSIQMYIANAPSVNAAATAIGTAPGGSQPHTNFQPYVAINYIISLFGVFPSQT